MFTTESKFLIVVFGVAVIGSSIGSQVFKRSPPPPVDKSIVQLKISPDKLLGFPYKAEKPIIVEFFDYQCPPCKKLDSKLSDFATLHNLDIEYKNFPLNIHPHAFFAATISESAKKDGSFRELHKELIKTNNLSEENISKIVKNLKISHLITDKKTIKISKSKVISDTQLALDLSIHSTPSLIVIKTDLSVW
ncbi:MAG: thioredoxin domain-containing protein, partial [Armatimonadetes bacterium]|nr:thioredoxin domain-containing protein [Armatimonadota bacterium]